MKQRRNGHSTSPKGTATQEGASVEVKSHTAPSHTKGRLTVLEIPAPSRVDHGWRRVAQVGNKLMLAAPYEEFFKHNDSEANARRLVACWNACDGISTETLERPSQNGILRKPKLRG